MSTETTLPIWQVDAFSSEIFGGNPAAVVAISGDWLADSVLQAIAAENNVSETAFVRQIGHGFQLRWFTPMIEVPLCGHATLATAAVIHEVLGKMSTHSVVKFDTASGPLFVHAGKREYTLDFPSRPTRPSALPISTIENALQVQVKELWESVDRYICLVDDQRTVETALPDMNAVALLPLQGVVITARGEDCDFVSRYFAPAKGVPEDPVTGTSHCALAPFWGDRLGKNSLLAQQLSHRRGEIKCSVHEDRVHLQGTCRLYLQGTITVPLSA